MPRLTPREKGIFDLIVRHNLTNKEIAARLVMGVRTVKFHVSNILSKYHVKRRGDLVLRVQRGRWWRLF